MDVTAWNERYSGTDLVWPATPNRWVVQELEGMPTGVALDLASGEGRNAVWLAEQGWSVTGVDFAENALAKAREQAARIAAQTGQDLDVQWVQDDILRRELPSGAYDLVLLTYVQLEAWERREVVRRCTQALAPGGTLLVVGHDSTNLTDGYGGPQDPAVLCTARDLEDDLRDYLGSGLLRIERADRVAREVDTDDGVQVAWDVLFRARRRTDRDGPSFG